MSFSSIVRRATSATSRSFIVFSRQSRWSHSLAPVRPLLPRGILYREERIKLPSSALPSHRFSSSLSKKQSDVELLQIIKSEIQCAEGESREAEQIPKGFPFEILDEKGANVVTLRRDYLGENIDVVVSMPSVDEQPDNNEEAEDGEANHAGDEKANQPSISLTVNISKGKGLNLEFCCTAYADEVVIDSLSVQKNEDCEEDLLAYGGPDFSDLDENLQKAFHKFLEIRGISPATTNFLYEYMISKDDKEYLQWLRNLKQFIEK